MMGVRGNDLSAGRRMVLLLLCLLAGWGSLRGGEERPPCLLGGRLVPGPLPAQPLGPLPPLKVWRDLDYGGDGLRAHRMDLYLPRVCWGQRNPCLLWIHGGGWHENDKEIDLSEPLLRMVLQQGGAVVSINYRLLGEDPLTPYWEQPVEDLHLALSYLAREGESLGIDPQKIVLMGHSAGAWNALMGAQTAVGEGLAPPVAGVLSLAAPAEFCALPPFWTLVLTEGFQSASSGCRQLSVLDRIHAQSPPTLILHGAEDDLFPPGQAWALHDGLRRLGRQAHLELIAGGGHNFLAQWGEDLSPNKGERACLMNDFWSVWTRSRDQGDLNGDGLIDTRDLGQLEAVLAQVQGETDGGAGFVSHRFSADLNRDGALDREDLTSWQVLYGQRSRWKLKVRRQSLRSWLGNRHAVRAELHDREGRGSLGPVRWTLRGENQQPLELLAGWQFGPMPVSGGWLMVQASWVGSEGPVSRAEVLPASAGGSRP